jgi:hypothetical protein
MINNRRKGKTSCRQRSIKRSNRKAAKGQKDQEQRKQKEIEEQRKKEEEEKAKKELEDRQKKELEEQQRKAQEEQQRKALEEQQRVEQEKERSKAHTEQHEQTSTDPELIKQWNQFDSIISGKEASKDSDTSKTSNAPDTTSSQVLEGTSGPPISQDVEVITQDPSDQIDLGRNSSPGYFLQPKA